jgi:hypothetical protein
MIPSGRQALPDAMVAQSAGMPPSYEKSKQLQPAGHGCPEPQSVSLGRHFMIGVLVQVGGSGAGQVKPGWQAEAPPVHDPPDSPTFTHWYRGSEQSLSAAQAAGSQVHTSGPGVQTSGLVVTTPSGPTEPPPEQDVYWAWQVSGAGQSAAAVHARILATQVPVVLAGGGGKGTGVVHFTPAGQVGSMAGVGMASSTQSKSALGQSATVAQTMGLGSQVPVGDGGGGWGATMCAGTPSGGLGEGAAPASAGGAVGPDEGIVMQVLPAGHVPRLPPAPPPPEGPVVVPVPTLVAPPVGGCVAAPGTHWYPVPQSESIVQSLAAAVRPNPPTNRQTAAGISKAWRGDLKVLLNMARAPFRRLLLLDPAFAKPMPPLPGREDVARMRPFFTRTSEI